MVLLVITDLSFSDNMWWLLIKVTNTVQYKGYMTLNILKNVTKTCTFYFEAFTLQYYSKSKISV